MNRTYLITIDTLPVQPTKTQAVIHNPQAPARVVNIAVDERTARTFRLASLLVGKNHQLGSQNGISLLPFIGTVVGSIATDNAMPGVDVTFVVENISDKAAEFHAVVVFEVLSEGLHSRHAKGSRCCYNCEDWPCYRG